MLLLLLVAQRFQRAPRKERSDRERKSERLSQRKRNLEPYIEKTEADISPEGLESKQE